MSDPDSSTWKQSEIYKQAKNRVKAKLSFYLHSLIYILANFIYVSHCWGNSSYSPIWMLVPVGWGLGVVSHYLSAFVSYKMPNLKTWVKPRFYLNIFAASIVSLGYIWYCLAAIINPIGMFRRYTIAVPPVWFLLPILWAIGLYLHYLSVFVFLKSDLKTERRSIMDILIERELQQQNSSLSETKNSWPPAN